MNWCLVRRGAELASKATIWRVNPVAAHLVDVTHPYHECVTNRDKLLHLVESLPEEQAGELLRLATELYAVPDQRQPLPAFVGIGDSGRSDVSERVDDLLVGGTDASVIATAERLGVTHIATIDRRHFTVVRPKHVESFTLLPDPL